MIASASSTGRRPEVAGTEVVVDAARNRAEPGRLDLDRLRSRRHAVTSALGAGDAGHLRRPAGRDRVHDLLLRRLSRARRRRRCGRGAGRRFASPSRRRRARLCEISTTPRPCSASRRTSSSTCSVWATPSAAVGSSRMTSLEFHITARATATDWRCPPERVATGWRIDLIVVTRRPSSVSAVFTSMIGSLSRWKSVVRLASEVHVLDDVEVVAEREVLVDDLDPEPSGVLRAVDGDGLAFEDDLALVVAVDACDALDQRRLAGAVVADERHHLSRASIEVDVGQRLHGAERLRDPRISRSGVSLTAASLIPQNGTAQESGAARRGASAR